MRRMKRQRVYTYEVRWQAGGRRPAAANAVAVRLVVPGAQVVPPERPLDPARPDDRALFYVTPLADGWLRGERLEALVDGRKVQELPLPSRVVNQRVTWALLVLAVLVPWLWNLYIKGPDQAYVPGTNVQKYLDTNLEPFADFGKEHGVDLTDTLHEVTRHVQDNLDGVHAMTWDYDREHVGSIALYIAGVLLVLTLVSSFLHREKRKRRVGNPIPLPEGDEVSPPLARRPAVEPVG
jgi:hypothetical protein